MTKNMIDNSTKIKLGLEELQDLIQSILDNLYMPIRKSQLSRFIIELFEYGNTRKQIEFAMLGLVDHGYVSEDRFYVAATSYVHEYHTCIPTATQEGIIKFFLSGNLKEQMKHYFFFDVYATERITPHLFFKYVSSEFPSLVSENRVINAMDHIDNIIPWGISNQFYVERNDFPTGLWLSSFLDDRDNRIIIKSIENNANHINISLVLLPGKRRSYEKAHENYKMFSTYFPSYFIGKKIHITTTTLTMITGNMRKNRKK